ncbi:MAG: DNA translocase FtsK, partial [Ruminococcaceae bacterium]|nr:DNA translocase FtsK [Oscillospiraceae bacterium]
KKAAGSLQWSVVEMMKRYRLFSEIGVRDLKGYNDHQKKAGLETLPSLVIVIDELADLMMTAAKEVEESICRVAQMGRAAGVHLIIATQRPSSDVITGLMKANIPSRIAFSVSSAMESRIILDHAGAEKLIGNGDMLFFPIGANKPTRVQGAYVSDEERERVIDFIKAGGEARYDENAIHDIERSAAEKEKGKEKGAASLEENGSYEDNPFSEYDELLPQAVDVILDTKQASVSMLQRRLKLGYARAARLVDQMEELGVVGPFEGSKPRQLLIDRQQWQEMSLSGRTPLEKLMDEQKDDFTEVESDE